MPNPERADDHNDDPAQPESAPFISLAGATTGPVSIGEFVGRDKVTNIIQPQPQRAGPPFSVPYPALDQPLIGRDDLHGTLRARLCAGAAIRLALDGLPGAGKTRLALALAYDVQIRQHFAGGIFMASLGQQPNLESVPRRWAIDLGLQLDPRANLDEQLSRIVARLNQAAQPCLLIVDDVWATSHAQPFMLASPYVSVLFTSRRRDQLQSVDLGELVGPGHLITIPPLDEEWSVALLRQAAELPAPDYQAELQALAILVGGLPLLLAAMGRYLHDQQQRQQSGWFERALDDLQQASLRLNLPTGKIEQTRQKLRGGFFARFRHKPVTKSLNTDVIVELSVHALVQATKRAFTRLAALPPDPLSFGADSAHAIDADDDALHALVQRNLLAEAGDGRFCLHRVLWDWAEQRDPRAVREARRILADWHASLSTPDFADEFGAWRHNPDNWQHMLQTWHAAIKDPDALRGALRTIVPLLISQAYWRDVLPGLERALGVLRRVDPLLATRVHYYIGDVDFYLADYAQAREHASAALDGFQVARSESEQVAAFSLLGHIESAVGDYATALRCYQSALDLTPETNQRNHAVCLNNLASLHYTQGDYAAARPLLERALALLEQSLGPSHPDTASSLNNLARLFRAQGDYTAARPLYERALQIREQSLGLSHPDTAQSLNNLAGLLEAQGDSAAARPLYERALQIREQSLGPSHPDTASSLNNLAGLFHAQGDSAAARPLYERALQIYEQSLGPNHPTTEKYRYHLTSLDQPDTDIAAVEPLSESLAGDHVVAQFTGGRALIIGVGAYQDPGWNAPITVADAQAVADALSDPAIGAYLPAQVRFLQGADASRAGIAGALSMLAEQAQATDTIVIFFAGHGMLGTDGSYYFATYDTIFEAKQIKAGTGLSAPDLIAALRKITSQKLLFIINACFSGHLAPATLGAPPSADFNVAVLATGEGRAIITASRPTQYSYYMPDAVHTFFGQALVDGLHGKAANGGGYIGLFELYQHLYTAVKDAAVGVQRVQEPVLTLMQGVGPFPVALYPGAGAGSLGTPAIRQSPPAGTALEQVPVNTVQAIGQGAQALNIHSGGNTTIDQSRKLIDFGGAMIEGGVKIGDVAGGNMTKIDIKIGPSDVAQADTRQQLLDLIGTLQAEVAQLNDAPKGKRQDAEDDLRKAKQAGAEGDKDRLLEKLGSAHKVILALTGTVPVALKLGETLGALIQRVIAAF